MLSRKQLGTEAGNSVEVLATRVCGFEGSQGVDLNYEMKGRNYHAVTMLPASRLDSKELFTEPTISSPYPIFTMRGTDSITKRQTTVLFADICGYTTLMEHDELAAHILTTNTLGYIAHAVLESGGIVREHAGDRLLIEFAEPQAAVTLAFKIAKKKFSWPTLAAFNTDRIRLRIGIHCGKVLDLGSEIRGKVLILAARVQESAKPGGIAITQEVQSYLDRDYQTQFMFRCRVPLKNLTEPVSIYDGIVE